MSCSLGNQRSEGQFKIDCTSVLLLLSSIRLEISKSRRPLTKHIVFELLGSVYMLPQATLTSIFLIVWAVVIIIGASTKDLSPNSIYKVHEMLDVFVLVTSVNPFCVFVCVCLCVCVSFPPCCLDCILQFQ